MRKTLLLGLIAAISLVVGFIAMSNIGTVSAKQWTGLEHPTGVAIGDYD